MGLSPVPRDQAPVPISDCQIRGDFRKFATSFLVFNSGNFGSSGDLGNFGFVYHLINFSATPTPHRALLLQTKGVTPFDRAVTERS